MKKIHLLLIVLVFILSIMVVGCSKPASPKINFIFNGEIYATITPTENQQFALPDASDIEGYNFYGWFWDDGTWKQPFTIDNLIILNQTLTKDVNIYAKYDTVNYTIKYNLNGYQGNLDNPTKYTIDTPTFALDKPIATIEFIGWKDQNGNLVSEIAKGSTGDLTLTAIWNSQFDYLYYSLTKDTFIIKGLKDKTISTLNIPNFVTSINSSAFKGCTNLKSVTFDEGSKLQTISSSAFEGCTSLESITIPDSVTSIDYGALYDCSSLKEVTLSNSIKFIAPVLFYGCSSLKSITIPNNVSIIGSSAFYGCTSLESITITSSVTSIDASAFKDCQNVKSVYYQGTLNQWLTISFKDNSSNPLYSGVDLYINNSKIINLIIPNSTTFVGSNIFNGCTSLEMVTIPASINTIQDNAFNNCKNLKSVYYDGTIEQWLSTNFNNNPLCNGADLYINNNKVIDLVVPNSVTIIKNFAFFGCTSLKSITIPNSIKSIGNSAFCGCINIQSATLPFIGDGTSKNTHLGYIFGATSYSDNSKRVPNTLKTITLTETITIGEHAFYECSSIENITIPNSVKTISSYAFDGCSSIKSIIIPNSVNKIDSFTFYGCSNLENITIPNSVESIGYSAFNNCFNIKSIIIPESIKTVSSYAFENCSNLNSVYYTGTLEKWLSINFQSISSNPTYKNAELYIDEKVLTLVDLVIPNTLTEIGSYTLINHVTLENVSIPSTITKIGAGAFYHCTNLRSCSFENTSQLTTIEDYVFYSCSKLENITIPKTVTYIGSSAFENCSNLSFVIFRQNSIVKTIEQKAFNNCTSLKSIVIPGSVSSIKNYAFKNCTSLEKVFYTSSNYLFGLELIDIGLENYNLTNAKLYYYSSKHVIDRDNYWRYENGIPTIWE